LHQNKELLLKNSDKGNIDMSKVLLDLLRKSPFYYGMGVFSF
jgi:hypothetical protein